MFEKISKLAFVLALFLIPIASYALLDNTSTLAKDVFDIVKNYLIPIAFSLGLLLFFGGLVKYIKSEGQGKEDGRKIMIWGVLALFVMVSVWGLVNWLIAELGLQGYVGGGTMVIPTIEKQ